MEDATVKLDIAHVVPLLDVEVTDESWDHYVTMTLLFSIRDVRYLVRAVAVGIDMQVKHEVDPSGQLLLRENVLHDINSVLLRQVRVNEIARRGVSGGVFVSFDSEPDSLLNRFGPDGEPRIATGPLGEEFRATGPTESNLALVAQSYNVAHLSGQPPAKAVERQFGLPPRTAAAWIAKAKALGFIHKPKVIGHV